MSMKTIWDAKFNLYQFWRLYIWFGWEGCSGNAKNFATTSASYPPGIDAISGIWLLQRTESFAGLVCCWSLRRNVESGRLSWPLVLQPPPRFLQKHPINFAAFCQTSFGSYWPVESKLTRICKEFRILLLKCVWLILTSRKWINFRLLHTPALRLLRLKSFRFLAYQRLRTIPYQGMLFLHHTR